MILKYLYIHVLGLSLSNKQQKHGLIKENK